MDSVLINLVCNSCSKEYIVSNGVQIGNCIVAHGAGIMHHLKTLHPNYANKYEDLDQKFMKLEKFNVSPFLLLPSDNKYKKSPLNIGAYIWKCQEIYSDLENTLRCSLSYDENENVKFDNYLTYFIIIPTNLEQWTIPQFLPINYQKGDEVVIEHTPFMCISLYRSWTRGIISNFIGNTIILIDSRLTENCEGAPVFIYNNSEKGALIAILISNLINDHETGITGFSLAVSLQTIFKSYSKFHNLIQKSSISKNFPKITDEMSIVKVIAGNIWGSGVIVSEDGVILTCAHVVHFNKANNSNNILAKIGNKLYSCEIIFSTEEHKSLELAVLIIKNTQDKFQPISLALRKPKCGEKVKAIGYHLIENLEKPCVSSGIISKVTEHFLISTCLVHKGASGGALIDNYGQLIAIITYNLKVNFTGNDSIIIPFINFCTSTYSFGNYFMEFLLRRDISPLITWNSSISFDTIQMQPFKIEGISPLIGKL